jgi:hypothetical protein
MTTVRELHDRAMDLAEQALALRLHGDLASAPEVQKQAYDVERQAAQIAVEHDAPEPTRSILLRSAASLALACHEYREAERLIALALVGYPPTEIADELRDLLEQVNFDRHLAVSGVVLQPNDVQIAMSGSAIGLGCTLAEPFIQRIRDFERLVLRTVERMLDRPFREHGPADHDISQGYSLYLTAPRAGSFAITARLGVQMQLPGFDRAPEIIDEVARCFSLLDAGQEQQLHGQIADEAYYRNFVALGKRIAPDGKQVSLVGLTFHTSGGQQQEVKLLRKQRDLARTLEHDRAQAAGELVTIHGRLLLADATKPTHHFHVVDASGVSHDIAVPTGLLTDIVRPMWEADVEVVGRRLKRNRIDLVDINPISSQ